MVELNILLIKIVKMHFGLANGAEPVIFWNGFLRQPNTLDTVIPFISAIGTITSDHSVTLLLLLLDCWRMVMDASRMGEDINDVHVSIHDYLQLGRHVSFPVEENLSRVPSPP